MTIKDLKDRYLNLPHFSHILIWLGVGVLLLLGIIYGGSYLKDKWNQRKYEQTIAADSKKAKDAETLRDQALGVAQQKNEESKEWQKRADEYKQQLDEALKVLA